MLHAPQLSADHNTAGGVNHKLLQISCDSLMSAAWFFIVCVLRDAMRSQKICVGGPDNRGAEGAEIETPKAPRGMGMWRGCVPLPREGVSRSSAD